MAGEIPDVIGFGRWSHSVLIECKISRSDYFNERNKPHRRMGEFRKGMGLYRLFCVPTGLIKSEELPEKWGLIYVDENRKARVIVNPMKPPGDPGGSEKWTHLVDERSERAMMYSALRRLELRGRIDEIYESPEESSLREFKK